MSDKEKTSNLEEKPRMELAIGVFGDQKKATALVEKLVGEDFPEDRISLLHKAGGTGDDMLGITYSSTGEKMKVWGEHGAFWGVLWGFLAGATGMFVLPGVGAVLAAGPIVDALAGATAGAVLTGGAMAGAAALSDLASALHREGIPEESLQEIHEAVESGSYVVILHCSVEEIDDCMSKISWAGADKQYQFPIEL